MQVRRPSEDQDTEPYASKHSCSTHQVTYYVPTGDPVACPVCDADHRVDDMRRSLNEVLNEVEVLRGQIARIEPHVNLSTAIKNALEICGQDDLLWLKTQMYQYKIDKSVTLRTTHGRVAGGKRTRGKQLPANGFMTLPRKGDPEAYACTSLGGLAIAEYFDEAVTTVGSAQAMGLLLKSMWTVLPGATT